MTGLVRRHGHWELNQRPPTGTARRVLDEYEVGAQAAKVWAWGPHYMPPARYAELRLEQEARDARRAAEPSPAPVTPLPAPPDSAGQLELFQVAS